ncbi:glycine cleavage system H protein [Chytriomyces sp. MP71]|nr:glycine cleavage system H protein [Chytriomyces sp. MP71]
MFTRLTSRPFTRAFTAPRQGFVSLRGYATKRYTKDHEWISVTDGIGTFGISDFAQKALGDVVYIELPEVGKSFAKKENISAVESVKAASDIYAPVSGEVVAVNSSLGEEPSLINSSPEGEAWIAKIKLSNPAELDHLLDEAAYAKHCDE